MKRKFNVTLRVVLVFALVLSQLMLMVGAKAQVNGISLTLAASEPTSYDHSIGGGQWNLGRQNIDIRQSLQGEDFKCNEIVSYLMRVQVPKTADYDALGAMTLDMNYSISMDTTGASGVALGDPVTVAVNNPDPANSNNGNSIASVIDTSQTGPMFSKGAELLKKMRLTGVESGETIIYRFNVKIYCQPGSNPTGNLQVRFVDGAMVYKNGSTPVSPGDALNGGNQTISLKNVTALEVPSIALSKTVTTSTGTCPGGKSITIEPKQSVKFCYVVTNNSNADGKIGAPLYNVTNIFDDNGIYPDFQAPITSGLTDIDGDGVADDLAIGASAFASFVTAFDGTQDSTVVNTATVTGYDKPNNGVAYTATDTATVYIDAPAPALTISKLTNGSDGSTFLVGTPINWTYLVTNTGDRDLSNVYVVDDQGVTVTCPKSTLVIGESMTCTASGTAIAGNYVNTGTAYGNWNGTQESATDTSSYFGADPKIDIQKAPKSQTVIIGQKATFSITVTNIGNVDLSGVVVSDPLSSDCNKTIGALAVSAVQTYTCQSATITADLTNIASVVGYYDTYQVTDNDSANVISDILPDIEVTKSADPISVPETGGSVTFTFSVKNKAPENFILTSLMDDTYGNLNGQGTCTVPQTIAAGATYTCTLTKTLASDSLTDHVDVLTAMGHDPENNPASGSDDARVTFSDVLPSMTVTKVGVPSTVLESGGNVTFTFVVQNQSLETLFLTALVDDKLGDLNGKGTCIAPQTIVGLGSYTCSYTVALGNWTTVPFDNTVTAFGQDNELNKVSANASFRVTFIDLIPTISVTKTVNPTIIRSSGDYVDYTITITNTGPEAVTVTSLLDPKIALSSQCLALVGQQIPIGGSVQCTTHLFMVIGADTSFINTVSASAKDNENNLATASASATLKSYWYGRSPGFWKNHPSEWVSGYLPTAYIQNVFTVPSTLLTSGVLDLDANKVKDTLMAGLAYKGGSTLSGAAQILFRASVAALLNKAYYGADYPAESSVGALIAHVNAVLATQSRTEYLALASIYDKWNNGVEGPLP